MKVTDALHHPQTRPVPSDVDVGSRPHSARSGVPGAPARWSSSSSTTLLSSGESGPPCGVPSTLGLTSPFSITPAFRNARMSFSSRLSSTRLAICAHQLLMVDPIEELLQINIYHPAVSRFYMLVGGFDGLMCAPTRSEPIAVLERTSGPIASAEPASPLAGYKRSHVTVRDCHSFRSLPSTAPNAAGAGRQHSLPNATVFMRSRLRCLRYLCCPSPAAVPSFRFPRSASFLR